MKNISLGIWGILASLMVLVLGTLGVIIINNGSDVTPLNFAPTEQQVNDQTLSIMVTDQNKDEKIFNYDFNLHQTNNLLTVFNTLSATNNEFKIEYKEFDFGKMIIKVNGYEAKSDEFWNIKINGADAQTGVSDIKIKGGDKVDLILTKLI